MTNMKMLLMIKSWIFHSAFVQYAHVLSLNIVCSCLICSTVCCITVLREIYRFTGQADHQHCFPVSEHAIKRSFSLWCTVSMASSAFLLFYSVMFYVLTCVRKTQSSLKGCSRLASLIFFIIRTLLGGLFHVNLWLAGSWICLNAQIWTNTFVNIALLHLTFEFIGWWKNN